MNENPIIVPQMIDINISWQGVKKQIGGFDSGKSPRSNDIRPKLLKIVPSEATSFLNLIFEISLRAPEVPVDWKLANITPLYKKGSRSNPSNYRPISLLLCNSEMEQSTRTCSISNIF